MTNNKTRVYLFTWEQVTIGNLLLTSLALNVFIMIFYIYTCMYIYYKMQIFKVLERKHIAYLVLLLYDIALWGIYFFHIRFTCIYILQDANF